MARRKSEPMSEGKKNIITDRLLPQIADWQNRPA